MRSQVTDMQPVDDYVTQNTPGLKIFQEVWGDMQCAYHSFAPGTDFTELLAPMPDGRAGFHTTPTSSAGTLTVIYKDGSTDVCKAGDVCYWPAPHNFKSEEGAEIIQFSGAGALAEQAEVIEDLLVQAGAGVDSRVDDRPRPSYDAAVGSP